jgi:hypothetical protein
MKASIYGCFVCLNQTFLRCLYGGPLLERVSSLEAAGARQRSRSWTFENIIGAWSELDTDHSIPLYRMCSCGDGQRLRRSLPIGVSGPLEIRPR